MVKKTMLAVLATGTVLFGGALAMAQVSGMGQGQAGMAMPGGMMGPGMMPGGMTGQGMTPCGMTGGPGPGMTGGMMGPCMAPGGMMGPMMGQMMSGATRGCYSMAERMMSGMMDLPQMQRNLGLSDEQADKLRLAYRTLQREAIKNMASLRVAELDLADHLSADKVDMGKVEAKVKELEGMRSAARLSFIKTAEEVRKVLTKEQLDKFEGMCRFNQPAPQESQPRATPPESDPQQQEHHQAQ